MSPSSNASSHINLSKLNPSIQKDYLDKSLLHVGVSFAEDEILYTQLKEKFPQVIVIYYDIQGISYENRVVLSNYILVNSIQDAISVTQYIKSIRPCECTHLGKIKDYNIFKFITSTVNKSYSEIKVGSIYQITEGRYKNLIVKVSAILGSDVQCKFPIMGKIRTITVNISYLQKYKDLSKLRRKTMYRSLLMPDKAVVIDGHNLLYRSIYANSNKYSSISNKYIGGGFGFYFYLLKIKTMFPDFAVYVCFDSKIENKLEFYPEYKKNRAPKTDKFRESFEQNLLWCVKLCQALGYPVFRQDNYEGDDLIGSIVHTLLTKYNHTDIIIYSQDGDFNQLLSDPQVRIFLPKKSFKQSDKFISVEDILAEYKVNRIDKVVWYKSLHGDNSDNILSINKVYKTNNITSKIIRDIDYLNIINSCDTLEQFRESLSNNPSYKPFIESGYFDKNLTILTIKKNCFDTLPFAVYDPAKADIKKFIECLREFSMFREIEFVDKNFRILNGSW